MSEVEDILRVRNLVKHFPFRGGMFSRGQGAVKAVDDVSFEVKKGETLGIVGESGCGKSTLGKMILRLLKPTRGSVLFEGIDLFALSNHESRTMSKDIQMVFQDPFASLNPRMKVGSLIGEPLKLLTRDTRAEMQKKILELLEKVGLNEGHLNKYPHEVSGGQRQRIGIARALILKPKLVVCDEPVSALDVSIQSQIINLLQDLQQEYGLTYLFISHDLSVIRHICDRVIVLYLGKIVEIGTVEEIFSKPQHPYTKALLAAIPVPDPEIKRETIILEGDVPNPSELLQGCRFNNRCPVKKEICQSIEPSLISSGTHAVACHCRELNERSEGQVIQLDMGVV
ncbi:ABC transporter ATP-binding protein [Desulfosporosinus sp. SYSU MS00001]|uniref:ABC transporter ATP-binding protein n=1 Tax=Desulfosporosinus sp. SYSU MS00001 TaxID=3416284 RepID=UPI003CEBEB54